MRTGNKGYKIVSNLKNTDAIMNKTCWIGVYPGMTNEMIEFKDDFVPDNFREDMEIYLKVSTVLRDLKRKFPIDLIVYTRPMYERFIELKSSFSKEILSKGINLL